MTIPPRHPQATSAPSQSLAALALSLCCAASLVLHTSPLQAATPQATLANAADSSVPGIVDLSQVEAARARGAILWDVRSADDYKRGHLPGAINFGDAGKLLRDQQKEDFLPTPVIEKLFSEAGLDPNREIVVYGARGNPYAYFGRFTVRYFGGRQVSVFHDGFEGWQEAGKP
ncbi:MAG: hypothetical protein KGN39_08440, partial [Betaproteobacteria bacterium]|nr:hypothetical protein [Betaproteobacteria bacterium]